MEKRRNQNGPEESVEDHNYRKEILRLVTEGKIGQRPGEVQDVAILHDTWCGVHKGQRCDCDPDIYVDGKRTK